MSRARAGEISPPRNVVPSSRQRGYWPEPAGNTGIEDREPRQKAEMPATACPARRAASRSAWESTCTEHRTDLAITT